MENKNLVIKRDDKIGYWYQVYQTVDGIDEFVFLILEVGFKKIFEFELDKGESRKLTMTLSSRPRPRRKRQPLVSQSDNTRTDKDSKE